MTTEATPLIEVYEDDDYMDVDQDECLPPIIRQNKALRYSLIVILTLLTLGVFYLLMVILPNIAPEGISIPNIELVKSPAYYLHPLTKRTSKTKPSDPEDPNKVLPDFDNWDYISSTGDDFKSHFDKLIELNDNIHTPQKRVIMIGDIHGCLQPLKRMLRQVNYNPKNDHVIMLGDFIDKGDDSIPVIEFAIENGIDCILGNHELEILKRYSQFHAVDPPTFGNGTSVEIQESYDLDQMMKIAKRLTIDHIEYLSKCSPIQSIGPVPHLHKKKTGLKPLNGVAAHGGIVWNKPLSEQNPEDVTTMRNLLPPNWDIPTDDRKDRVGGVKSKPWTKIWNAKQREYIDEHQKLQDLTLGSKVFYGHDAKRGVQSLEFSQGLDSGCVYGKRLTGVVLWAEVNSLDEIVYKERLVEVNC